MNTEKVKEILIGRLNKLTDDEREWICENNNGWYNRYLLDYKEHTEDYSNSMWESLWLYSAFGQCYLECQGLAKKFLSSEKKMNHVMDMMDDRKGWYSNRVHIMKNLHANNRLTQNIMTFIVSVMRQHNRNIFESYVNDPMFGKGSIVQFRSNIGCDAIVIEDKRGRYYGATKRQAKEIKGKTLMVLGECPPLGTRVNVHVYSHKHKQGGSRLYRVLPIGGAKVYIVVEKFLKKCRAKAVKDAQS